MPKSPAQHVLDAVIRDALVPVLKQDGYRKSGHTFRRWTGAARIQVVNVQASAWGTATRASFTVNLGVYFPEVERLLADTFRPPVSAAGPCAAACHVRTRIGALLPDGRDTWWDVEPGSEITGVVANVRAAFTWHGRPWLESMLDLHEAYRKAQRFNSVTPWVQAALALAVDDRRTAREILARATRFSRSALILEFAKQHGLAPLTDE